MVDAMEGKHRLRNPILWAGNDQSGVRPMKADKNFDFYEFAGIVMPGAILIFGLAQAETLIAQTIPLKDMSLGSLGVFLILSYAAGHLLQSLGRCLEKVWWYRYGMPSDWVLENKLELINDVQRASLIKQLPAKLGLSSPVEYSSLNRKQWHSMVRQIYAAVAAQNRSARVDVMNGNYGLNRGLCVALVFVAIVAFFKVPTNWSAIGLLCFGSVLAALRMHRFGKHYAHELFVQFLQLPIPSDAGGKSPYAQSPEQTPST
jgi:hypothetical protein